MGSLESRFFQKTLLIITSSKFYKKLRKTNALILNLTENIKGNVFNQPFPFITFQRVSSSEQLPKNLKLDGDPWSDFFITLNSFKHESSTRNSSSKSGSGPKSGFIILAFKVTDDDSTPIFDRTWAEWTGSAQLTKMLARKYEIRKVACYKGVNVCPDVFKYVTLIEFLMYDGDCDTHARDCMQKFRIFRMSGYAALYQDFRSKDIEQAIDETQSLNAIMESIV